MTERQRRNMEAERKIQVVKGDGERERKKGGRKEERERGRVV